MNIDLTAILDVKRIDGDTAVLFALLENKEGVLGLNDDQLDDGINALGQDMGEYKNFSYKGRFKPIDLKLKGDLRAANDISFDRKAMEFIDTDYKVPFLTKRYGQIIGLTDKNIRVAAELIHSDVILNIEKQLS